MKSIRNIIFIIAALAAFTSCKHDDTLAYNNITMGNIADGTFTSDQGNIFNVVEKNCTANIEEMDRAIVRCDVLNKVEGTDNEYDIRLQEAVEVLTKKHITKETADAGEDTAVSDPIWIRDSWISGGYLNLFLIFEIKEGSGQKHLVNLILDEEASTEDKYAFILRHNSFGESAPYEATELVLGSSYVSFPLSTLINKESAEIEVRYEWYKSAGDGFSSDIQEYSFTLPYMKGGFEHVPDTPVRIMNCRIN